MPPEQPMLSAGMFHHINSRLLNHSLLCLRMQGTKHAKSAECPSISAQCHTPIPGGERRTVLYVKTNALHGAWGMRITLPAW